MLYETPTKTEHRFFRLVLGDYWISLLWEPRDCWIGLYWDLQRQAGVFSLYLCVIPTLPLRIQKWI